MHYAERCDMTWLVTGGAGYIGSHVVAAMRRADADVVVYDDLSSGVAERIGDTPLIVGSVLDEDRLVDVMRGHGVSGVVHLAAKKQVAESVHDPLLYWRENVEGLRSLLAAATTAGIGSFVFSSSAAVYGAPDVDLITEATDRRPVNPYGWTKLVGEQMVADVAAATGLRYASLRYFNVAGADSPELADLGAANLVPLVFQQLSRHRAPVIFGDDYDTPDGTCIRDFVHVADIAGAHVAAADALADGEIDALSANIGRGEGVSVREMVATIRRITGTVDQEWAEPVVRPRRPGDPARVVASADLLRERLGCSADRDVEDMVSSAWAGWQAVHVAAGR
jgi:UDP-glucose 4-epimerase